MHTVAVTDWLHQRLARLSTKPMTPENSAHSMKLFASGPCSSGASSTAGNSPINHAIGRQMGSESRLL